MQAGTFRQPPTPRAQPSSRRAVDRPAARPRWQMLPRCPPWRAHEGDGRSARHRIARRAPGTLSCVLVSPNPAARIRSILRWQRGALVYLHLFAELKRRRVFRALVGYGIAAFAILQIVEPVMHGLRWPEVTLSYVVVALAIGFPIVVTLAWIFDVNAGRLERTPASGSELKGARVALVLVAIGVLAAAPGIIWYFILRGERGSKAEVARAASIAVLPFANLSGGQENDYFSDGVTEDARARTAEVLPKARAHARKAAELDDSLAEAHTSLGMVSEHDYDWSGAEREYKRAIELKPGYATAHHWYFLLLQFTGHLAEAREEAERARQLDPTSAIINGALVGLFLDNREYDRAIEQALKGLELNPNFELARVWLAVSYRYAGKVSDALAALEQVRALPTGALRAQLLALAGDRVAAQQLLADVEKRFPTEPVPRGSLALAHLALGDKDGAFLWLQKGVEERDQTVLGLKVSPQWDPIRSDPRYHTLLKRMKLE